LRQRSSHQVVFLDLRNHHTALLMARVMDRGTNQKLEALVTVQREERRIQ